MEDSNKVTSLLDDGNVQEQETSLLDEQTMTAESVDVPTDFVITEDINKAYEIEKKKQYLMDPKNQAQILLTNYINSQEVLVNHAQKRKLYAEFYRNAKKGKYRKLFNEQIYGVSRKDAEKKFAKLNA